MSEIRVGEEIHEKWHMKPLEVEEGDRVRFTFTPPKSDDIREKVGTVNSTHEDTVAYIDVDDAGTWVLKHGAVKIVQEGRSDRYNGSLLDFEKIPREGMKIVTDSGVVAEVLEVHEDRDSVHVQRSFNPTSLYYDFDDIDREVR